MNRRTIGANIRYYRHLRGITQEKLAELVDLNDKLISFYETDKRIPSIYTLIEIADALCVTPDQLCGLSEETIEDELMSRIRIVLKDYEVVRK